MSFDYAQVKIDQLASDLITSKEAHEIVLETKDSVMRSLVKQNTILVKEVIGVQIYLYAFSYIRLIYYLRMNVCTDLLAYVYSHSKRACWPATRT